MKRNVDLSELQLFTTFDEHTEIFKMIMNMFSNVKPWDFENQPQEITDEYRSPYTKSLIAVGSKEERQTWKKIHDYKIGQVCDCCGQTLSKKLWISRRCRCSSIVTPKIPWKF